MENEKKKRFQSLISKDTTEHCKPFKYEQSI